jgi:very-short-patch-repair endonuclease
MSHLEQRFADLWVDRYPSIDLHSEYRFSPPRRYRWDFCHLESRVAIEINGQIWQKGGHSSGKGLLRDYEKLCLAAAKGWRVFLLADSMITDEYLELIATAIASDGHANSEGVCVPLGVSA